jgi:hypothetical protein
MEQPLEAGKTLMFLQGWRVPRSRIHKSAPQMLQHWLLGNPREGHKKSPGHCRGFEVGRERTHYEQEPIAGIAKMMLPGCNGTGISGW